MSGWMGRWLLVLLCSVGLAGCSPQGEEHAGAGQAFENADGSISQIPSRPQRILSTSVTVTGTLLAIDAPVLASASAANGRFFAQWESIAQERGVENLWPAAAIDLEAAYALEPDLIIVSASGADSALDQLAELQAIAPTIIVDYAGQTWQALALQLGQATGLQQRAQARIESFDQHVADVRSRLQLPDGEVNIISFNGPGISNPIATASGVHGQLLEALGFRVESPDPAWHAGSGARNDFVWAEYEHLLQLKAPTSFLVRVNQDRLAAFLDDPVLANLPSVQRRQVYSLGANSFRIDYYSASEIVDGIQGLFAR